MLGKLRCARVNAAPGRRQGGCAGALPDAGRSPIRDRFLMGSPALACYISGMTMRPWCDYSGRVSPLKTAVFVGLFLPGLWVAANLALGTFGARPLTEAIHQIGLWTLRFIFIALAITPARRLLRWPRLILVRRMIGIAACAYGLTHLSLYFVDEAFNLRQIAWEIATRIYLTIGFTALSGLVALAVTSTDGMVRRMGARRWQRLHRIVYGIGTLAVLHFFMQSKLDEWEPTVMAGIFVWLMGWRALAWAWPQERWMIGRGIALSLTAGALTMLGEAGWFWLTVGVDPMRVLMADFSLQTGIRPGWIVLAASLGLTLLGALSRQRGRLKFLRLRPA